MTRAFTPTHQERWQTDTRARARPSVAQIVVSSWPYPCDHRLVSNRSDVRSDTRAVAAILAAAKVVAPVDVIVRMGWLSPDDLEAWRFGRVPYLERVIRCNLTRLSRFLRILGFHCHDLKLTASQAAHVKLGKGRRTPLRFTKTGDAALERVCARHFVWPGKGPFHPPRPRDEGDGVA